MDSYTKTPDTSDKERATATVMAFGAGPLQASIIRIAKKRGLRVVAVDPDPRAKSAKYADEFLVIGGQDYQATLDACRKYRVAGIFTAATDKPLVMMARVAQALHLPSISVATARISTDKYQMKQTFHAHQIPCAKGVEVKSVEEAAACGIPYPVVLKPVDNSGSRGVVICPDEATLRKEWPLILAHHTHRKALLVEEFMPGREYSVEALHLADGTTRVIQITEKTTTPPPYNVEIRHIQPAPISDSQAGEIRRLVAKVGEAFQFHSCASHTELKITPEGRIRIIETSPRLGGDCINSHLTPRSTGVNIEEAVLTLSLGRPLKPEAYTPVKNVYAGIRYFDFEEGSLVKAVPPAYRHAADGLLTFTLQAGDTLPRLTESASRYGYAIATAGTYEKLVEALERDVEIMGSGIEPPKS